MQLPLKDIKTPAYIADKKRIKENLATAAYIKEKTGCKILLATKSFSMFSIFDEFAKTLDGTTASGYYEAKLGHDHFAGEVHAYSPAFTDDEIASLKDICTHISFNSVKQLEKYGHNFSIRGLRVNPRLSLVKNSTMYDPSAENPRFGIKASELTDNILEKINLIHVHNLCENLADDSVSLINHIMQIMPKALDKVEYINLGGGHYINHPDYDVEKLIDSINKIQKKHNITAIIEPGGALVYEGGCLVSTVLDVSGGFVILDTSATCHMPDVLEVPYRPNVMGDKADGKYSYTLTGKTCLTGDIIGDYRFDRPLKEGDKVIFTCMMQYTMVKNTSFNGLPLPDIGILEEDGSYRLVKTFAYKDFEGRLS